MCSLPHLTPILFPAAYGAFLRSVGEDGVSWRRASCAEDVLKEAHVVRRRGVSHERGLFDERGLSDDKGLPDV